MTPTENLRKLERKMCSTKAIFLFPFQMQRRGVVFHNIIGGFFLENRIIDKMAIIINGNWNLPNW